MRRYKGGDRPAFATTFIPNARDFGGQRRFRLTKRPEEGERRRAGGRASFAMATEAKGGREKQSIPAIIFQKMQYSLQYDC